MTQLCRWQVGAVTVTRIVEIERMAVPTNAVLVDATPETIRPYEWLTPHFATADGRLALSFHAFLVQTSDRTILIDACLGADRRQPARVFSNLQTAFLENLAAAGATPSDVNFVFCTHLHYDHVGWNTRLVDGSWVPTFPHARYLLDRKEYDAVLAKWTAHDAHGGHYPVSIEPVLKAGLVDFIDGAGFQLCPEVRLVGTPGHTPGHASVAISSEGKEAIITGDLMHNPVQCALPEHPATPDEDQALATLTRLEFLKRHADRDVLILGSHFPAPTGGWIKTDSPAWRFDTQL